MKRKVVITVAACLALGVVTNVGVAWGIAFSRTKFEVIESSRRAMRTECPPWPVTVPEDWPSAQFGSLSLIPGLRVQNVVAEGPHGVWIVWQFTSGWPQPSMQWSEAFALDFEAGGGPIQLPLFDEGLIFEFPTSQSLSNRAMLKLPSKDSRILPLKPVAAGFLVNTVFYSVILWLLLIGFIKLRQMHRIRRGHCPKCNYDIQQGSFCPECGWKAEK